MKAEIISRWLLVVLGVLWLGAGTWYEFLRDDDEFELRKQLHEERFQQRVNDCRGSFSERYECKTAADRENQMANFKFWAERLSIICVPPRSSCTWATSA